MLNKFRFVTFCLALSIGAVFKSYFDTFAAQHGFFELDCDLEPASLWETSLPTDNLTSKIDSVNVSKIMNNIDILDKLDMISGGSKVHSLKCPHPLKPFKNVIVRESNTTKNTPNTNIPKILHFSFTSRCLPQDLFNTLERWKKVLPNYSIFFHDDEAVANLIEADWPEFPDLRRAMKCVLYKGAMTIDIWRVLLLYKYGGVYSDIDNWPLDPFNEDHIRSDLSFFSFEDRMSRPSQWFMAAEPHHPIMYLTMNKIIQNLFGNTNVRRPKVVYITGPQTVGRGYYLFLAPECCNGTASEELAFRNDMELTGMFGKVVFKSSRLDLVTIKYGYNDIVPYNSTLNVTRGHRISMESGTYHWHSVQSNWRSFRQKGVPRSCKEYLDKLDKGELLEDSIETL